MWVAGTLKLPTYLRLRSPHGAYWSLSLWPWYHIWWLTVSFVYLSTNTHNSFPLCQRTVFLLFTAWLNNIINITNWFHSPCLFHCLSHSTPSLQLSVVGFCRGRFFWFEVVDMFDYSNSCGRLWFSAWIRHLSPRRSRTCAISMFWQIA